jgi:hypothetical protein
MRTSVSLKTGGAKMVAFHRQMNFVSFAPMTIAFLTQTRAFEDTGEMIHCIAEMTNADSCYPHDRFLEEEAISSHVSSASRNILSAELLADRTDFEGDLRPDYGRSAKAWAMEPPCRIWCLVAFRAISQSLQ